MQTSNASLLNLCHWIKQNVCYLFKTWLREISFGKFMTILDLWYLIAKSCKNFTGGKEKVSAIVVAIIIVTKTLHVKAMSSPLGWICTIDNTTVYYKLLNAFSYDLLSHPMLHKWALLQVYIFIGLLVESWQLMLHLCLSTLGLKMFGMGSLHCC